MKNLNKYEESVNIKIPFHDIDLAQVVWHGNYVKYLEIARSALLKKFDYDITEMLQSDYAWPVIELKCRFTRTVQYGHEITVTAKIIEIKNRLKISYTIIDSDTKERVCRAHTIQVAINMVKREMCLESPEILFDKLGATEDEELL
ncbi:MAG: acyl-CoA thioesterase [Spirochaetia bacterium]|nr:acyl-CoA thioesterase [Spirochaetia bacterium]